MVHATTFPQRARLALVAAAAVALGALTAGSAPRLTISATMPSVATPTQFTSVVVRPTSDTMSCGHGAYVTGDMVGDASPAAVYSGLCGSR